MHAPLPTLPTPEREGFCNRCGSCCTLQAHFGQPDFEMIRQEFYNPPFEGLKENGECALLTWVDNMPTCSIYDSRPQVCRDFPEHQGMLLHLSDCSYQFVHQGGV